MEEITVNLAGKVERRTWGGRDWLVVPLRMIVPGVLNGSDGPLYYSAEENAKNPDDWNGMPIVLYHPTRNGRHVSARDPDILEKQGLGYVFRAKTTGGPLDGEGWFDVERTRRIDLRVLQALEAGRQMELSTGLYVEKYPAPPGATHNGRPYVFVARNYKPDHLAVLPDQKGACSLQDGCGVLVNTRCHCPHPAYAANQWHRYVEPLKMALTVNQAGGWQEVENKELWIEVK